MRKRMVTRTVTTTEVELLCLNIVTAEPFNETAVIPGTYTSNEKILKVLRPVLDTEETKIVSVSRAEIKHTLYGMSEGDFIKLANVMPPRKKADEPSDVMPENE
jgi:hypothetical protein